MLNANTHRIESFHLSPRPIDYIIAILKSSHNDVQSLAYNIYGEVKAA